MSDVFYYLATNKKILDKINENKEDFKGIDCMEGVLVLPDCPPDEHTEDIDIIIPDSITKRYGNSNYKVMGGVIVKIADGTYLEDYLSVGQKILFTMNSIIPVNVFINGDPITFYLVKEHDILSTIGMDERYE